MKHDISSCLPFWDSLSEAHRSILQDKAVYRSYKKNENVLFRTVKKDGILFVLSGGLRVYIASDSGREITLFHLGQGDAFSIMTVDDAGDTDVIPALQSDGDTQIAYLQSPDLGAVAREEWQMSMFVYKTCSKTAQAILNNISYYIFNNLRSCVVRELLEKCSDDGTILVTHEEIANSLGTTRVVISREIDNLRNMGLIGTGRGKIKLLDTESLKKLI